VFSLKAAACGWPGDGEFAAAARMGFMNTLGVTGPTVGQPRVAAEMTALGHYYRADPDQPDNGRQAAEWYRRAAQLGDAEGQYSLALMLDTGQGVSSNPARARQWYRRAAAQGYVHAQHHLAEMLRDGRGGRRDPEEALRWYLEAAGQGHADVYGAIARMYWEEPGVPRDSVRAYRWLRKAILAGQREDEHLLETVRASLSERDRQRTEVE
jgi:TPR repeat protein